MTAIFGPGGEASSYRYMLHRDLARQPLELPFEPPRRTCLFLMLNPSYATATINDPTIRRCRGFGLAWGFTDLSVGNLFGYRATDPAELLTAEDPIGPMNDEAILSLARAADRIVCAWGLHGRLKGRAEQVQQLLREFDLWALRLTKDGHPSHPLYLPNATEPFVWRPKET
jgi:hypothetical protein